MCEFSAFHWYNTELWIRTVKIMHQNDRNGFMTKKINEEARNEN